MCVRVVFVCVYLSCCVFVCPLVVVVCVNANSCVCGCFRLFSFVPICVIVCSFGFCCCRVLQSVVVWFRAFSFLFYCFRLCSIMFLIVSNGCRLCSIAFVGFRSCSS